MQAVIYSLPILYSILSRNFVVASLIVQAIISLYFIYKGRAIITRNFLFFFPLSLPAIYFERQYYIVVLTGFSLYEYQKRMNLKQLQLLTHNFVKFANIYGFFSIVFFLYGTTYFYEIPEYESYIFSGVHRLLGLDGSPAIISVFSGVAILLLFQDKSQKYRLFFILLHFLILFWTSSRASIIALILSIIFATTPRILGLLLLILIVCCPFLLTIIYMSSNNFTIMFAIELFSSNRIVNWVNSLHHYIDSSWLTWIFGYGHMPVLESSYLDKNLLGTYTYDFVSYSESSWVKIITCYGVFGFALVFFFFRAYFLAKNVYVKQIYFFIAFCAIFYEASFSVQYFCLILIVFSLNSIETFRCSIDFTQPTCSHFQLPKNSGCTARPFQTGWLVKRCKGCKVSKNKNAVAQKTPVVS